MGTAATVFCVGARRHPAAIAGIYLLLGGCAAPIPARPSLPAVQYVSPCHPEAIVALTAEGVEALRDRDRRLQSYTADLECALTDCPAR